MKKFVLAFIAMLVFQSVAALAADFSKSTPALIEKGKKSYQVNCLSCHGEKGDGNGPAGQYLNPKPRNFADGKFKNGDGPAQIFDTLTKGLPGTAMVSFKHLSEEDRWALVHYVKTFKK